MGEWNPTRIRWVDGPLDTSTGATRVETDDGPAFAKFLGNPEGPHTLFCEVVGSRAARWLGLPTFEIAVLQVDTPELVSYVKGGASLAGPAFLARYQQGAPWAGSVAELQSVMNPEVLAGLIVLDTWLLNCDRYRLRPRPRVNHRNLFLSSHGATPGKSLAIAMDHTHTFTCGSQLTRSVSRLDNVRFPHPHGHFPEFQDFVRTDDLKGFMNRLAQCDRAVAAKFVEDLPAQWEVQSEVQVAVVEFLVDRARYVSGALLELLAQAKFFGPQLDLLG